MNNSHSKQSEKTFGFNIPDIMPEVVYHYTKYKTLIEIIEGNRLKFSTRNDLNDPFDCDFDMIDFSVTKKNFNNYINKNKPHNIGRTELRNIKNSRKDSIEKLKTGFMNEFNSIGVCCFSTKSDNRLCWGQYADKFNGVAIGMGINIKITKSIIPFFVEYEDDLSQINYFSGEEKTSIGLIFQKKHKDWEHEREFRIVSIKRNGLLEFDKNLLLEIVFGLNETKENILSIKKLLLKNGYNNVKLKKLKKNKLRLEIKPIDH
ncbi:MAG: DUF2971 domain-containing protein [Cyclobacteriaceae bacterium]